MVMVRGSNDFLWQETLGNLASQLDSGEVTTNKKGEYHLEMQI